MVFFAEAYLSAMLRYGVYDAGGKQIGRLQDIFVRSHERFPEITRIAVHDFWEYAAFIANSVIFLLIGAQAGLAYRSVSWGLVALAVVVVLIARAIVVYPLTALTHRAHTPIPWSWRHTLVWGGLRGSIAMALVLGLPRHMPYRNEILVMTFAIVIFTLVGQGLTMRPLLRLLGLSGNTSAEC